MRTSVRVEGLQVFRPTDLAVTSSASCLDDRLVWYFQCSLSGNNSVVECDLAKVEVAGSNPVSRSIFFPSQRAVVAARFLSAPAGHGPRGTPGRRSQVVRQRSAKPPSPVQIRTAPPISSLSCAPRRSCRCHTHGTGRYRQSAKRSRLTGDGPFREGRLARRANRAEPGVKCPAGRRPRPLYASRVPDRTGGTTRAAAATLLNAHPGPPDGRLVSRGEERAGKRPPVCETSVQECIRSKRH